MKHLTIVPRIALALLCTALLCACGRGGGGDPPPQQNVLQQNDWDVMDWDTGAWQ